MVTLTATYLDDLGRIRLTAGDLLTNVRYTLQRSTALEPTWVDVRGGGNISTMGVTVVDDYEYTPNMENFYRLLSPAFYDSFERNYPVGAALETIGAVNSIASTPDNAALDIVGDLDLRVDFESPIWPPNNDSTLIAKYNDDTNNRSYRLDVLETGHVRLTWSTNGTNNLSATSTGVIPIGNGQRIAVRATIDVDNGAGGRTIIFYTAPTIDDTFTQLGASVTQAGTTSIFSGTALLEVAGRVNGTRSPFEGFTLAAQVRNGIAGAIVANPRFVDRTPGDTVWVDSAGRTWTVGTAADIVAYAPIPGTDWGTADTGQVWTTAASLPGFSLWVDGGVGVIQSDTPTGSNAELITPSVPGTEDSEALWSALYPDNPALLAESVEWEVALRAADASNYYASNLRFRPSADGYLAQLRVARRLAGGWTALATVDLGTWTQNQVWNVRFRVEGNALSAKAWEGTGAEPTGWMVTATDNNLVAGDRVYVRGFKASGVAYKQYFGPITVNSIPTAVGASVTITPEQPEVWLKSITYPLFNRELECVDWDELSRTSRAGFFNVKGRHEILAITDVGSSASFSLSLVTRSRAENRALVALLTYGGVLYLQPPGDTEDDCALDYSGTPGGYVVPSGSVQRHAIRGQAIWTWEVEFTRVAPSDTAGINPTTITWEQLWEIIGPDGTWEDVWATWPTWQALWQTTGSASAFNGGVIG